MPYESLDVIDIQIFFKQIKALHGQMDKNKNSFDPMSQEDIQSIVEDIALLDLERQQLVVENKDDVLVEASAGIKGYDSTFSDSQESFLKGQYPFAEISLTYLLPVEDRELKSKTVANKFALQGQSSSWKLPRVKKWGGSKVLSTTLKKDFKDLRRSRNQR